MLSRASKEVTCKPQFISLIHKGSMEKMEGESLLILCSMFGLQMYVLFHFPVIANLQKIPTKFLKHYVEEYLNTHIAVLVSPLGKFCRIEFERNQSGIFFAGCWLQFLAFHGIVDGDVLLFSYEGNMMFRFKAFGLNGLQKYLKNQNTGNQQSEQINQI
jgi:hypothetical protein